MPFSLRMRARSFRWAARTSGWRAFLLRSAQVGVQRTGLCGVVAVVGVRDGELPQRAEVGLDRISLGRVSRGEGQLDRFFLAQRRMVPPL